MAFTLKQTLTGHHPALVERAGEAGVGYAVGDALKFADGSMAKCQSGDRPEYICMTKLDEDAPTAMPIATLGIDPMQTFVTQIYANSSSLRVGDMLDLDPGASLVMPCITGIGIAKLLWKKDDEELSEALVQFV